MATKKQTEAAKENVRKAQKRWQEMTPRQHALAQPEGRSREKPGAVGEGDYFRIAVRPKEEFVAFRYHDVGEKNGDLKRLAGKRSSGSWDTESWLINKHSAHMEGDTLVGDTDDVRDLLEKLGSKPKRIKGDIFEAKDRQDIPEIKKPTAAQQKARMENIRKAQAARWQRGAGNTARE